MKRFVNNLFSSLWSSYRGLFLRLWSTSKAAALIVCGLVPVTLCLVLANTVTGGNKTSATPTSIPATAIARAINTAAPTLAIPTITPIPAKATELPTATKSPPTNTPVPTNTVVSQTPTSVATNSPTPQASNTPKPVIKPTEAPKVANTPTPLPKVASVAIAPNVTATIPPTKASSGPVFTQVNSNRTRVDPEYYPCQSGQIKGSQTGKYHAPGMQAYAFTFVDVRCFNTAAEAEAAKFVRAQQ